MHVLPVACTSPRQRATGEGAEVGQVLCCPISGQVATPLQGSSLQTALAERFAPVCCARVVHEHDACRVDASCHAVLCWVVCLGVARAALLLTRCG